MYIYMYGVQYTLSCGEKTTKVIVDFMKEGCCWLFMKELLWQWKESWWFHTQIHAEVFVVPYPMVRVWICAHFTQFNDSNCAQSDYSPKVDCIESSVKVSGSWDFFSLDCIESSVKVSGSWDFLVFNDLTWPQTLDGLLILIIDPRCLDDLCWPPWLTSGCLDDLRVPGWPLIWARYAVQWWPQTLDWPPWFLIIDAWMTSVDPTGCLDDLRVPGWPLLTPTGCLDDLRVPGWPLDPPWPPMPL